MLRFGWRRIFIVILAVVGNDTGGYLFGSLIGKHKLLPRVSPSKTWEGFIGGVLFGTLHGALLQLFLHPWLEKPWSLLVPAAVSVAAALAAAAGLAALADRKESA